MSSDSYKIISLGLDYVNHEDVLPYNISDPFSRPIHHELFDRFFYPKQGKGENVVGAVIFFTYLFSFVHQSTGHCHRFPQL